MGKMKTIEDILHHKNTVSISDNSNERGYEIEVVKDAMKEAQVEAIKELLRRKWSMMKDVAHKGEHKLKSVDDIALELIKEIEG